MLKKVREPIFKSADPDFNNQAAQNAYDLVMKMDIDTAREFTSLVVGDVLEETIEKNLRTLQRHLDSVVSKRISTLKAATLRASVSKSAENSVPFAQALALIEKAQNPYQYGYRFNESDYNRSSKTGRFQTKVRHNPKSYQPLSERQAKMMGIPEPTKKMSAADRAQYQDEWRQLASFLGAATQSGADNAMIQLRNKGTGDITHKDLGGTHHTASWDPETEHVVGAFVKPTNLTVGGAAFGLTSALGGDNYSGMQRAGDLNRLDQMLHDNSFADDWYKAGQGNQMNSNDRLYGRMKTGSQFLGQVAPAGSKLQIAAKFGEFVGEHGPEAEMVIGPTARKTAYRYRGTERKPEKELISNYETAVRNTMRQEGADPDSTPRWGDRDGGRETIINNLRDKRLTARSGELYGLQLASGNTPPSEGVILNGQGQIVTQAVGYGDDHYLPFNLKNLKGLKGGEYIRNRSVGGPTTEDIYTGLVSGARALTVTSRNGTYRVEFENDFRGGRRHNDKARRMVGRYAQLLDAVQSEQVQRKDVSPAVRKAITTEMRNKYGDALTPLQLQGRINERIKEFKSSGELTDNDQKLIDILADQRAKADNSPDAKAYIAQQTRRLAEEKEYNYKLNGRGYAAALDALAEQFPYYIKVSHTTDTGEERRVGEMDQGYVEPGRNRPTQAAAGLFGTKGLRGYKDAQGKFSARDADYQRGKKSDGGGAGTEQSSEEKATATATAAAPAKTAAQALDTVDRSQQFLSAAVPMQQLLKSIPEETRILRPDINEAINMTPQDLMDTAKQAKFHSTVEGLLNDPQNRSSFGAAGEQYRRATSGFNRQGFDPKMIGIYGNKAPTFPGEGQAYQVGAPAPIVRDAMNELDAKTTSGLRVDKPLSQMTEQELAADYEMLAAMRGLTEFPLDEQVDALRHKNMTPGGGEGVKGLFGDQKAIEARMLDYQKMRALKANMPAGDIVGEIRRDEPTVRTNALNPAGDAAEQERVATAAQHRVNQLRAMASSARDQGKDRLADEADVAASALDGQRVTQADMDAMNEEHMDLFRRWQTGAG